MTNLPEVRHEKSAHARAVEVARREWPLMIAIILPPAVFDYVIHLVANHFAAQLVPELSLHIRQAIFSRSSYPWADIFELGALKQGPNVLAFFLYGFAFAAVSVAIWQRLHDSNEAEGAEAAYNLARERLIPLLATLAVLFVGFVLTLWTCILLIGGALIRMKVPSDVSYAIGVAIYLLVLGILVPWAFAVPAVTVHKNGPLDAFRISGRLTRDCYFPLWILLIESELLTYVMSQLPYWIANQFTFNWPAWTPWALSALSTIGVMLVLPLPMAGTALLYSEAYEKREELVPNAQLSGFASTGN